MAGRSRKTAMGKASQSISSRWKGPSLAPSPTIFTMHSPSIAALKAWPNRLSRSMFNQCSSPINAPCSRSYLACVTDDL